MDSAVTTRGRRRRLKTAAPQSQEAVYVISQCCRRVFYISGPESLQHLSIHFMATLPLRMGSAETINLQVRCWTGNEITLPKKPPPNETIIIF